MASRGRAVFSFTSDIAAPTLPQPDDEKESDYDFSDFDDEALEELNKVQARINGTLEYGGENQGEQGEEAIHRSQEDNPIQNAVEYTPSQTVARLAKSSAARGDHMEIEYEQEISSHEDEGARAGTSTEDGGAIAYPDLTSPLSQIPENGPAPPPGPDDQTASQKHDPRSPLERFRPAPYRALSVTDLVSPSWCELQFSSNLSRHGKKPATPAMKAGTVVHQTLEAEVFTNVPVTVEGREEGWGLKIWNLLQGLEMLREEGRTRELAIWGLVGGEVVGGVIDQVSFDSTDPVLEGKTVASKNAQMPGKNALKVGQTTLSDFLQVQGGQNIDSAMGARGARQQSQPTFSQLPATADPNSSSLPSTADPGSSPLEARKLYITDIKTRTAASLPRGASFTPTKLQLMLYHRLLSSLLSGGFDFEQVTKHYGLNYHAPFSDGFIQQIAIMRPDHLDLILSHNSIAGLWSLVGPALARLGRVEVSDVLCAEYRDSQTGDLRGTTTFSYDSVLLDSYVREEMNWWKGERRARGVVVQEAWKCRSCEFADGCEWRRGKVDAAVAKARRGRKE